MATVRVALMWVSPAARPSDISVGAPDTNSLLPREIQQPQQFDLRQKGKRALVQKITNKSG